ncbi:MAG: hypothetical protein GY788_21145 [bacterium]|nr:hypothetical protein [bacterium]
MGQTVGDMEPFMPTCPGGGSRYGASKLLEPQGQPSVFTYALCVNGRAGFIDLRDDAGTTSWGTTASNELGAWYTGLTTEEAGLLEDAFEDFASL